MHTGFWWGKLGRERDGLKREDNGTVIKCIREIGREGVDWIDLAQDSE